MRRVMLLGAAVLLVGCGPIESNPTPEARSLPADESAFSGDPQDFVIVVPPDSEIARMVGSDVPTNRFVASTDVEFDAGTSSLWETSTEPATDDEAAALAGVLGIAGGVSAGDPGFGTTHLVGSLDGEVGQLSVFDLAEPTWGLQPSLSVLAEIGADGSIGAASSADVDAAVDAVVAVAGVQPEDYTVESLSAGALVEVRIEFAPAGVRTDVVWNLTIAPDGSIIFGEGPVRAPRPVGEVATVGLDEALLRLSRVTGSAPVRAVPAVSMPPLATTVVPFATSTDDDGASTVSTAPLPIPAAQPIVLPTIIAVETGLVSVWDISNREWLVPAIVVSSDDGFTTTIPIISSDHLHIADASEMQVPVRTGPPLTIPQAAPSVTYPTTTMPLPPSATTAVPPQSGNVPSTTALPSSGPTLPRPTLPVPAPTLLAPDGPPMTLPIPPDPNEMTADQVPEWYGEALNTVLVARPLNEAIDTLQRTGWIVRTDDLDDPNETFDADLVIGRATVEHRNGIVVNVGVG